VSNMALWHLQAHSSVEKAGLIGLVKMHLLMCDEHLSLRGKILREAIAEDKQRGLIPFYVRLLRTANQCNFVPRFSRVVHVYQLLQSPRKTATYTKY